MCLITRSHVRGPRWSSTAKAASKDASSEYGVAFVFDLDPAVQHVCFDLAKPNILKSYAIVSVSLGSF